MPTSTLKLRTNVPLTGFVRAVYYNKGKLWRNPEKNNEEKRLPDSVALKGSWDGSTDETLYLPVPLLGAMMDMGLLQQLAGSADPPRYTVLNPGRKVRIIKIETGNRNEKRTFVSWADAPPPEAQESAPPVKQPVPPSSQQVSPPQQTSPQPAPAKAKPAKPATPASDAQKVEAQRRADRRRFGQITETVRCSWLTAKTVLDDCLSEWRVERTKMPTHVYFDLLHRIASTLSIQAHRENLVVERGEKTKSGAAPAVSAQAGSVQGAGAPTKPVDPTPPPLAPAPAQEPEPGDLDGFPESLTDDDLNGDLPF